MNEIELMNRCMVWIYDIWCTHPPTTMTNNKRSKSKNSSRINEVRKINEYCTYMIKQAQCCGCIWAGTALLVLFFHNEDQTKHPNTITTDTLYNNNITTAINFKSSQRNYPTYCIVLYSIIIIIITSKTNTILYRTSVRYFFSLSSLY
jgi:hypothetical protein